MKKFFKFINISTFILIVLFANNSFALENCAYNIYQNPDGIAEAIKSKIPDIGIVTGTFNSNDYVQCEANTAQKICEALGYEKVIDFKIPDSCISQWDGGRKWYYLEPGYRHRKIVWNNETASWERQALDFSESKFYSQIPEKDYWLTTICCGPQKKTCTKKYF